MRKTIKIIFLCIGIVAVCIIGYNTKESVRIKRIVRFHVAEQPAIASDLPDANTSKHIVRAVQQIMIGTLCNNYDNALQTLRSIKAAGYEAIELNDFMIRKTALSVRLNRVGKVLAERGIRLLYHNHNVELQKVAPGKTAYDIIIEKTNPLYVNTEIHSLRDMQRKLTK